MVASNLLGPRVVQNQITCVFCEVLLSDLVILLKIVRVSVHFQQKFFSKLLYFILMLRFFVLNSLSFCLFFCLFSGLLSGFFLPSFSFGCFSTNVSLLLLISQFSTSIR